MQEPREERAQRGFALWNDTRRNYFTRGETALILDVSLSTFDRMVKAGRLRAHTVSNHPRFTRTEIMRCFGDWLREAHARETEQAQALAAIPHQPGTRQQTTIRDQR